MDANTVPVQTPERKNFKPLFLGIILGILFFAIGFGGGLIVTKSKYEPELNEITARLKNFDTFYDSAAATELTVSAAGMVVLIDGQKISIERNSETLEIPLTPETTLSKLTNPTYEEGIGSKEPLLPRRTTITVQDIKIGDPVTIIGKISKDGAIKARQVTVMPSIEFLPPATSN